MMRSPARRRFLAALPALAAVAARPLRAAVPVRVVVIGGGWGGLAAAAELRRLSPMLDVTLLETQATFFSLPLSNGLLAGMIKPEQLQRSYAAAAGRHGYRFRRSEAIRIDRGHRVVVTREDEIPWDWLVLATGLRYDYAAWTGGDAATAAELASRWGGAMETGAQVMALNRRLAEFDGGELVMTIPEGPQRCPPASYERAAAILHGWQRRGLQARLTVIDAGAGFPAFRRTLADRYGDRVRFVPHAAVTRIDPERRRVHTEFDEFRFDQAVLVPPASAGRLAQQAELLEAAAPGRPAGWVAVDARTWHTVQDDRIYPVGDLLGSVSPLFGHLPKTAHVAAALGRLAAQRIAGRISGMASADWLPESVCHVTTDYGLPEGLRIDAVFRRRGDGVITQSVRQERNAQPRGEDQAWLEQQLSGIF